MAKEELQHGSEQPIPQVASQAQEQTGAMQVRLRLDDRKLNTTYSNAFRTNTTAEEVLVDFGMNLVVPTPQQTGQPDAKAPQADMLFELNQRIVMNYYTAKRLALMLGQLIRHHEERFGEIKLNANERTQRGGK